MVHSQTNLAEMERIYLYFTGKTKGMSEWKSKLKELFPEAQRIRNGVTSYDFDPDKIWETILQVEAWRPMIEKQRINSFWELSIKVTPDDMKYQSDENDYRDNYYPDDLYD